VARSTIQDNLKRAAAVGLAWPLADDVTDDALERQLFGRAAVAQGQQRRVEPDWAALARELKRPGVTMAIFWEEYREPILKATATAASTICFVDSNGTQLMR
jgi:transposase